MADLGTASINEIFVIDRKREELGDIEQLAQSIKDRGQIQPIAVKELEGQECYRYQLLAGERRLLASQLAGLDNVLVRIYPANLSPLEAKQIELAENYHRKDFTWQEKVNLQREIYETEVAIQGKRVSTSVDAPGHSMTQQAKMLGVSQATVSQDFALARAIEEYPDAGWEGCKTQHEAMKLKKRVEEKLVRHELAKRFDKATGSTGALAKRLCDSYFVGDFFEGVKKLDRELFDLVEIDPPYAIDLQKSKRQGGPTGTLPAYGLDTYNEVDDLNYETFMRQVFADCYRVMKPSSWLICWFGPDPWFEKIYQWLCDAKFQTTRLTAVWVKKQAQANNPSKRLANATEHFFYAWKGEPVLARPGMTNVFDYSAVPAPQKMHPTERPVEMMRDILSTFAMESARVLIPFAGSGNTLLAATMQKMLPLGFELEPSYKDGYVIKINQLLGGV